MMWAGGRMQIAGKEWSRSQEGAPEGGSSGELLLRLAGREGAARDGVRDCAGIGGGRRPEDRVHHVHPRAADLEARRDVGRVVQQRMHRDLRAHHSRTCQNPACTTP